MKSIFLSASIPLPGRGRFHEDADPFLIQLAVREFMTATLGRRLIVWGGHPAITPMVWAACEDLGVSFADAVVLYQSLYFREHFPEENKRFKNVVYTPVVENSEEKSLQVMRSRMLERRDLSTAVFIGGMEGIFAEYELFRSFHSKGSVLLVRSPGGAAAELARRSPQKFQGENDVDFATLFHRALGISPLEPRTSD